MLLLCLAFFKHLYHAFFVGCYWLIVSCVLSSSCCMPLVNGNCQMPFVSDACVSDARVSDAIVSDAFVSDACVSDARVSDAFVSDACTMLVYQSMMAGMKAVFVGRSRHHSYDVTLHKEFFCAPELAPRQLWPTGSVDAEHRVSRR